MSIAGEDLKNRAMVGAKRVMTDQYGRELIDFEKLPDLPVGATEETLLAALAVISHQARELLRLEERVASLERLQRHSKK